MKVRDIRSAIEGLRDDADVVLRIHNEEYISHYEELGFYIGHVGKSTGEDPHLTVIVTAYDADDVYDEEEEENDE